MQRRPDDTSVPPPDARSGELPAGPRANGSVPRGPVMVVGWWAEPAAPARSWGDVLTGSGEFARQLGRFAGRRAPLDRRNGDGAAPVLDAGLTFRIALPEAFGAEPLLQPADPLRRDGAPRHAGVAARGVPVPLSAPRPGAPVPGAPLGLMALTLLVEIATTDVQNRVLTELTGAVHDLAPAAPTRLDARLRAAEETLRAAQTALLERGRIGAEVGLGTAVANLSVLRHQTVAHLAGWERVVEGLDRAGAPGTAVRASLGEVGRLGWAGFPGAVHGAYQALVLDARRLLLAAAEQQLRVPERPMTALGPLVEADLVARAADVARLRRVMTRLSVTPLSVRKRSGGMLPRPIADQALDNARAQALFTRMANALTASPRPNPGGYAVEVQSRATGDLQILRPAGR